MARRLGARNRVFHRNPNTRDRIWQSMRILRRFSAPEIISTAESTHTNVMKYLRGLRKAGIVRVAREKINGAKGGHAIYQLVRDLGPIAPRLQSDRNVFDPNSHTTLQIENTTIQRWPGSIA